MGGKYTTGKLNRFIKRFLFQSDKEFSAKIDGRYYLQQELTFYYEQLEKEMITKQDIRELCKSVERCIEQEAVSCESEITDYFRNRIFAQERNYGVLKEKLLLIKSQWLHEYLK